jgi:hypothetical protein
MLRKIKSFFYVLINVAFLLRHIPSYVWQMIKEPLARHDALRPTLHHNNGASLNYCTIPMLAKVVQWFKDRSI